MSNTTRSDCFKLAAKSLGVTSGLGSLAKTDVVNAKLAFPRRRTYRHMSDQNTKAANPFNVESVIHSFPLSKGKTQIITFSFVKESFSLWTVYFLLGTA